MAEGGDSRVLREYLISLGFKVDSAAKQHFGEGLTKWDKAATKLARSLVGVAVGAQAMATEFAFRMERLYYASRLAESAAGNLQALDFGGKQAGIKDFTANVLQFARAIRANPGLQGLLNSLGVRVEGRDKADVLLDFVKALRSMPFYVAQRYASLFGIDPDELKLMQEGLEKIKEAAETRKQLARDLGIDTEAANRAGLEYARQWREIVMYVGQFRDALSLAFLGPMSSIAGVTKEVLADWIRIAQQRDAARGITPASAVQSGLTVDEQKEMAARLAQQNKSWTQMTPDEREAKGMGRDAPTRRDWSRLTPEERTRFGMPATEADMPAWARAGNWINRRLDSITDYFGLSPANPYGGAELSSNAKERLGYDRTRTVNPATAGFFTRMKDSALDAIGYRSRPKVGIDPAAIEAATEPSVRAADLSPGEAPVVPASVPPVRDTQHPAEQAAMRSEEQARGLPPGLLDYIWRRESGRGKNLVNRNTATGEPSLGPFQFQPKTGRQFGLDDKSIMEFTPSMKAASAYIQQLMGKYNGDLRFALAAYNWGQGNLDKLMSRTMEQHGDWSQGDVDQYVLGHLPEETRKYIAGLGGGYGDGQGGAPNVTINSDMKIDVHEATDGQDVARRIADNQRQVWGDVARQFSDKVR